MKIDMMPISAIRPYEKNPRKNDRAVEAVANSIEQYGFQQPIVVDNNMVIVVGHTRYRAAQKLNLQQVPVLVAVNLDDKQTQAYRIMDNRSNENARWDDDLLVQELEELLKDSNIQDLSFDTGFTESELDRMFRDDADPLDSLKIDTEFRSRVGDIWTLGAHKLMNGDSTNADYINQLLVDERIDLVWEDPPYGVAYETANGINHSKEYNQAKNHKIENDSLSPEKLAKFLGDHLNAVMDHVKPGSSIYWCHDIRYTQLFRDALNAKDVHISDTLIWRKNNASTWLSDYAKYYEPILYGWKKGVEHNWYGKNMQPNAFTLDELKTKTPEQLIKIIQDQDTNYQEFSKEPRKIASIHPTVKPVKLIVYHIINSSKTGDIVYDGFSGSGSTLIAAHRTGRHARCVEFEPKFVDAAIARWQEETGLKAYRQDGIAWDEVLPEASTSRIIDVLEITDGS